MVRIALGFANRAELARSNLGFRIVERLLAAWPETTLLRFFLRQGFPAGGSPLRTEPRGVRLSSADLVFLSLSFESDAIHIPALLEAGGLPSLADRRCGGHPLVIAGGAAVMINPEPIAAFCDLLLVGEAEVLLPAFLERWQALRGSGRAQLLAELDALPGALSPLLRQHSIWSPGREGLRAGGAVSLRNESRAWLDLPQRGAHDAVETIKADPACAASSVAHLPHEAHFPESFLVELARGCPRACRFCVATRIYRPYREWPVERLLEEMGCAALTGETVGLLALSAGDYRDLEELTRVLRARGARLSISSLPASFSRSAVVDELLGSGATTLTIAPETGTDRLRAIAGKPLRNEVIIDTVRRLGSAGLAHLRAYFLIGLPFEREEDLRGISALLGQMRLALPARTSLSATVNPFVPKPQTPFQWAPHAATAELTAAAARLRKDCPRGVRLRVKSLREARLHAALTRGDVTWSERLARASREGRGLASILRSEGLTLDDWTGAIEQDAPLPWGYLLRANDEQALRAEWRRAHEEAGEELDV